MSFLLRPVALMLLLVGVAAAQPPAEPTADDLKALRDKFQAEREQALKAKFPADALARADDLVKRADDAAKADNTRAAARHLRDARWQLPYLPPGLPEHVTRVLGESRLRHADRVNGLAYSPDGKLVASASKDGTAKVWDLGNGREVSTYRGHVDQPDDPTRDKTNVFGVADVAFHPKGAAVATASGNQVHLWDPLTGKATKTLLNLGKTDKPIKCLAYSPDGKRLAVGGDDGILRVIESDSGKATFTTPTRNSRIERVAFSPNGKLIATGDSAMQVAVYLPDGKNTQPAMSVQGVDNGEVAGVGFTADSAAVFTAGRDGKARLSAGPNPTTGAIAANTATKLRDYIGHSGPITDLAVTADGKLLITGGDDKSVRVWETPTGKQLRSFQGHMTKVTAVAVRGDGRQVASASEDGAVRVWDLNTTDDHRAMTEAKDSLWAVAISPDGKRIAAGGADKKVRVYDPATGKLEATLDAGSATTALAFLPDGKRLVSAGGDRLVKLWNVADGKKTEFAGHTLAVLAVAASEDGKLIVSGAADATVRGFDPDAGKEVWKWPSRKAACAVAIRKGGKHVAVGLADGTLTILEMGAGGPKELSSQATHTAGVAAVAFSPDGSRLATAGGDGVLRVWSVGEGVALSLVTKFDGQAAPGSSSGVAPLSAVAFAPDGRFVAAGGADGVVRVWDVQLKTEARGLRGHTDWVTAVCFSPDGRMVASGAAEKDGALRVFDLAALGGGAASGGHMLAVNAVAVSPSGRFAATAAIDQTIKVWDVASGREVATLVGNADQPLALAFLGDAAVVMGGRVPGGVGRLHFWNTTPPRLRESVASGVGYTILPSPDGSKFGVCATRPTGVDDKVVSVYEVYDAQGKLLSSLTDKGRNVRSATFAADLSWAAAGDESGTVRVWDIATKERVGGDWPLFQKGFVDLGMTADKKLLVAADEDGTVKVADIAKREVLASAKAHKAGVRALVVSPTAKTFVTIGEDREVKAWSLTDLKELKELRSWALPVGVNAAAYTPDGRSLVTANADGTAYVLELP